jgi:hypothetical protein
MEGLIFLFPIMFSGAFRLVAFGKTNKGRAIYIKNYLKAKRRIMETQIFHHAKI